MGKIVSSAAFMAFTIFVLVPRYARPAEYYVDKAHPRAADANPGSKESPWLTIQKAASYMKAGDTCFVMPGTYDERVSPDASGTEGRLITFKAVGRAVVRGFQLNSRSYVRLIGFEITQTSSFAFPAVQLMAAHHCQILDNNIHHTSTIGIFFRKQAPSHHVLVRGNTMSFIGSIPGREIGEIAILVAGNSNLIEYNDISHVADFTNVWGERNIIRNNHFHDNTLNDYRDFLKKNPQGHHIDGLQYYSDKIAPLIQTLVENNLIIDNDVPHAHVLLLRNIYGDVSRELLFRGNIVVRNGSIAILAESFPDIRIVHNTFVDLLNQQVPKNRYCLQFSRGTTNARILNNIFHNSSRPNGITFYLAESSRPGFVADHNLVFKSGNPSQRHGVYKNPLFSDQAKDDYRLQERSPAIDAGAALTLTAAPGTGTSVPVHDAGYFSDGWGISAGDLIRVGASLPARISHIDYAKNVIEVDRPLTWSTNDPVQLDYSGKAPDIGALERQEEGREWDVRIVTPAAGSPAGATVPLRTEVSGDAVVRFVVLYVRGIPVAQLDRSPFLFTWDTSGLEPGPYEVEARAYVRNADPAPTKSAKITVILGSPGL